MSPQKNFWLRHLSMWMSVYFFIANTIKVESNKIIGGMLPYSQNTLPV